MTIALLVFDGSKPYFWEGDSVLPLPYMIRTDVMYGHLPYGPTAALSQIVMPGPSNPTLCDGKSLIKFDGKSLIKFDG